MIMVEMRLLLLICNCVTYTYVLGRLTGLVTFCVETAFYNGLLKERRKLRGDRSDRKKKKKT
jgi:hypothetical protein